MLAKECVFTDVTKEKYRDELTRDAFINGLNSTAIRQRLLEVDELDLRKAHELADSLDRAQHYATMNVASTSTTPPFTASLPQTSRIGEDLEVGPLAQATAVTRPDRFTSRRPCPFCGEPDHKRTVCPARYSTCFKCGKRGLFSKVCRAYDRGGVSTITQCTYSRPYLSSILASAPNCLEPAIVTGTLAGATVDILLDTGASNNFIDSGTARKAHLSLNKVIMSINMAAGNNPTKTFGRTKATLSFLGRKYVDVTFDIIEGLCADVILGQDFLKMHSEVTFKLGGDADKLIIPYVPMEIAALSAGKVSPPRLFEFMDRHAQPYASRSRQYSREDQAFIRSEVQRLIGSDIIEASRSPWRAQVLVVKESTRKKRMVIDYSQTVNRYTQLDAYPLPKIEQIVNNVAADTFYSSLDLRSAYHQVPLLYHERPYTAFEADGCLYQYKRLPFGVTNGVSAFQRVIDRFIARHQLKKVYAYLDDITVTGSTLQEHDKNLNVLLHAAQQDNLTFNEDKSKFRVTTLDLLGYRISFGNIRPDPHRLQPLLQLPPPRSSKELKRIVASLGSIQDDLPFEVESDASDYAIAAILSQNGRPVAFMSRTLNSTERHYPAVEKEETAIVEAVRKWSHFLKGRSFSLITDQRSVAFMFDQKNRGKIKNSKLLMWRLELSQYDYKIRHKPGISNVAPDTFSCVCSHVNSRQDLWLLHRSLGHPGFALFIIL
ncbi:retrovirus-related Pol polyprotein from transposon opus [Ciona intestinalis]